MGPRDTEENSHNTQHCPTSHIHGAEAENPGLSPYMRNVKLERLWGRKGTYTGDPFSLNHGSSWLNPMEMKSGNQLVAKHLVNSARFKSHSNLG